MKNNYLLTLCLVIGFQIGAMAQCDPHPIINGDSILCPGSTGILSTQEYDSYQWFRREFLNGIPEAIPGATEQTLQVGAADVLYYFWVEVTEDTCTAVSPEILLDTWVFLLPSVASTGDYTYNGNTGNFEICKGDTMFLTLNQPYQTQITWFKNGLAIPDEQTPTLAITESGNYTVQGAPEICPDFIQPLGLELPVVVIECVNSVDPDLSLHVKIFPNPATSYIDIEYRGKSGLSKVELLDVAGRVQSEVIPARKGFARMDLRDLPAGLYFVRLTGGDKTWTGRIVKN